MRQALILSCVALSGVAVALNNGLARTPPMAYSSWNDRSSNVTDQRMRYIAGALIKSGLAKAGYGGVHVDEGWLKGRSASGDIIVESGKFPFGMKSLGDWIHNQSYIDANGKTRHLTYGLYTSRGTRQCGTSYYSAPGSEGHEKNDAQYFASCGADYAKIDSCGAPQDQPTALKQYELWRDSFNETGRPIVFSLCGWHPYFAEEGNSIGNLWRVDGDGRNWYYLITAINANAYLGMYAGPGGWNDPDLLQGDGTGSTGPLNSGRDQEQRDDRLSARVNASNNNQWYQTAGQSKSQMGMWSVMAAPLIISADVGPDGVGEPFMSQWGNTEVIAVDYDPMGIQGMRVVGEDLNSLGGTNVWARPLVDGSWAVALLNNNAGESTVKCGPECWGRLKLETKEQVQARRARLEAAGWRQGVHADDLADEAWEAVYKEAAAIRGPGGAMTLTGGWGNAVLQPGVAGEGKSNLPHSGFEAVYWSESCDPSDPLQQWEILSSDGVTSAHLGERLDGQVQFRNRGGRLDRCLAVSCDGQSGTGLEVQICSGDQSKCRADDLKWTPSQGSAFGPGSGFGSLSSALNADLCLDQWEFNTSFADAWECNQGDNQQVELRTDGTMRAKESGHCLALVPPVTAGVQLRARDLFAGQDVPGTINPESDALQATLPGNGSIALYKVWSV